MHEPSQSGFRRQFARRDHGAVVDGIKYYPVSSSPLFVKSNFKFSDGSVISNTRIERPQVVLDDQHKVIALLVALGDGGDTSLKPEESGISIIPVSGYNPNAP